MSDWIRIGRRKGDPLVMYDWHKERAMIEADTALISRATDLEVIPGGFNGLARGMVLTNRKWGSNLYCLIKRDGWTEDNYFNYAEKRFKELGIIHP